MNDKSFLELTNEEILSKIKIEMDLKDIKRNNKKRLKKICR